MSRTLLLFLLLWSGLLPAAAEPAGEIQRQPLHLLGIPLADHYAAVVAYEKYRTQMRHADFRITILPGPELVRAYFRSRDDADAAMTVAPMVMDMFHRQPDFRWVSLAHRDGNALAINHALDQVVQLPADKRARHPDQHLANGLRALRQGDRLPVIAIPSALATHTTILYKYLKDQRMRVGFRSGEDVDVLLRVVKPPDSIAFLKRNSARAEPAAFEQSLPWPEIAESEGHGKVAWYSRDVLRHPQGHVECVLIAKDSVIANKREALQEVIHFIHQAGRDIENAARAGGTALDEIVAMIRQHLPNHSRAAIRVTLRGGMINFNNLNVDANARESFRDIMNLAHEAGFIQAPIDIDSLADDSFATEITRP